MTNLLDFCETDEQLKRNFSCKICFEPFSKGRHYPISLNCGHTFCARCVKQLGRKDTIISCGLCRKGTYSDFRQLGKNVTLLDLLEHANLLGQDDPNETEDEEETSHIQSWLGPNHFLTINAFTAFLERHTNFRATVRQLLSPTQWPEFDEPLNTIRIGLLTIEGLLREAGDTFALQEGQLEELEHKFQRIMVEYYHQQQRFSSSRDAFVPIRWAVSDDSNEDLNLLALSVTNSTETMRSYRADNTFGIIRPSGIVASASNSTATTMNLINTFGARRSWELAIPTPISTDTTTDSLNREIFGVGPTLGCPPLTRNSERRRTRKSKKRTHGSNNGDGSTINFIHELSENEQQTSFNSWGIMDTDEWDQSGLSNNIWQQCLSENEQQTSFNTEGILDIDEWDQSALSNNIWQQCANENECQG